jgi:hypothetical protein
MVEGRDVAVPCREARIGGPEILHLVQASFRCKFRDPSEAGIKFVGPDWQAVARDASNALIWNLDVDSLMDAGDGEQC